MQAFRMAEKQISLGGQVFSKPVNYFYLCLPLEINEHVAAENQVKWASDCIRFLSEIEPLKSDDLAECVNCLDFAFLGTETLEQKLSLIVSRHVGDFLGGPDPRRSVGQNLGREISSENLDIPSGGWRKMRQYRHGQGIGFFTGRTRRAPDPQRPAPFAGLRLRRPFR